MVLALKNPHTHSLMDIPARVQRFNKSLGFAHWQPEWKGIAPSRCFVVENCFEVTLLGFKYASASGKYSLKVDKCEVKPKPNQTKDGLSFILIAENGFFPVSSDSKCHFFTGTLEITYEGVAR